METVLVKDQGGLVHHLCHLANVPTARHLSAKLFKWCAGDAVQTSVIGLRQVSIEDIFLLTGVWAVCVDAISEANWNSIPS